MFKYFRESMYIVEPQLSDYYMPNGISIKDRTKTLMSKQVMAGYQNLHLDTTIKYLQN